jgi:hypothetical protein
MAKSLIDGIKPSNFKVGDHLWGSPLKDPAQEAVARNIILISLWNDDSWSNFSWEDYREKCRHMVTDLEKEVLDELVEKELLKFEDEMYHIKCSFISTFKKFIK